MKKQSKTPWLKWYPADWRQEPTLRLCSRSARSLWVDMICLMHEGEPYGHLTVNGKPLSNKQLSAVLGDPERDITKWLAELEEFSVLSRTEDGVIYSRRMIRDKERDERNKENGKAGGNPTLKKSVNPPDKGEDKAQKPEARSQTLDSYSNDESDFLNGGRRVMADALRPHFDTVKGGAKRFAGLGEREKKLKPPDKADQAMAAHLTTHCGMDAGKAWELLLAARDPANPDHIHAARTCEKQSREHRLGWFHGEAAE